MLFFALESLPLLAQLGIVQCRIALHHELVVCAELETQVVLCSEL